jgi:enolase
MANIKTITGQKIFNSLGEPTLEVQVILETGETSRASVPSGAFTGKYEAVSLKDIDKTVRNIAGPILQSLRGQDPIQQKEIDGILISLDNTSDKSQLGGNTLLGVSLAVARSAALLVKKPLYQYLAEMFGRQLAEAQIPSPMFNLINGGAHADNNLTMQEFMVVPVGQNLKFSQKFEMGTKIFQTLEKQLKILGKSTNTGDEGGFAPQLNSNEEALEILVEAIQKAGFKPGQDAELAIDVAADGIPQLSIATYPYQPIEYYRRVTSDYPLTVLEDPFKQDDWQGWIDITSQLGSKVSIVGDDLFSTNLERLKRGIQMKAANSISIKPNQIGTLTETLEVIKLAQQNKMQIQISHRAGETEDTFISDLAVAVGAEYLKAGAPNRGERIAKYDQVLRIEKELLR